MYLKYFIRHNFQLVSCGRTAGPVQLRQGCQGACEASTLSPLTTSRGRVFTPLAKEWPCTLCTWGFQFEVSKHPGASASPVNNSSKIWILLSSPSDSHRRGITQYHYTLVPPLKYSARSTFYRILEASADKTSTRCQIPASKGQPPWWLWELSPTEITICSLPPVQWDFRQSRFKGIHVEG